MLLVRRDRRAGKGLTVISSGCRARRREEHQMEEELLRRPEQSLQGWGTWGCDERDVRRQCLGGRLSQAHHGDHLSCSDSKGWID